MSSDDTKPEPAIHESAGELSQIAQAALKAETKRSYCQRLRDWLWGYDFFISYHWASAGVYAVNLAQILRSKGFDVFLDRADYASGDDWKRMGQIALRNTQRLVLVATREAVTISKPVQREVEIFTERGRQVIPIIFGDRFEDLERASYPTLQHLPDSQLFVDSGTDSLATGPTIETVDELIRTHKVLRRRKLRQTITIVVLSLLATFSVFATVSWINALAAEKFASQQTRKVTARLLAAESRSSLDKYPQRGILLAVEALGATKPNEPHVLAAEQALRDSLAYVDGVAITEHSDKVTAATITHDGQYALTASWDGTIRVWDYRTKDHLRAMTVFRHELGQPIDFLAVSADNKWLFNLYRGQVYCRKFDLTDPLTPTVAFGNYVNLVDMSPDGHWCVTGGRQVQLWNFDKDDFQQSPIELKGHKEEVVGVAFGNGGKQVASADKKGMVCVWDNLTANPSGQPEVLDAQTRLELKCVAFSVTGNWIATGDIDGVIRLWHRDPVSSSWKAITLEGHQNEIMQLRFTRTSSRLISCSKDKTVRVWTMPTVGTELSSVVLTGHEGIVTGFVIGPEDRWVASTSQDQTVRLWNLQDSDPSESALTFSGHEDWVQGIATDLEGRWLISASWDGTARIWNLVPDEKTDYPLSFRPDAGSFFSAVLSPDEQWLVGFGELPGTFFIGGGAGTISVWDLSNPGKPPTKLDGHEKRVSSHVFTSDSSLLVTGSRDNIVRVWQRGTGSWGTTSVGLELPHLPLTTLAISPNDRWLVTGSMGGMARLWDLNCRTEAAFSQSAKELSEQIPDRMGTCHISFSADGNWLAIACEEVCWMWDMTKVDSDEFEKSRIRLDHRSGVDQLHFTNDGRWLFTLAGSKIYRWPLLPTSETLTTSPFSEWIHDVVVTRNDKWLIGSSHDYPPEIRFWRPGAADFAKPHHKLRGHGREAADLATTFDSKLMATSGGFDNTVRLWSLDDPPSEKRVFHLGKDIFCDRVFFSHDEQHLFAVGVSTKEQMVRGWDLRRTDPSAESILFRSSEQIGQSVGVVHDSRWLMTLSEKSIRLWTLDTDELLEIARRAVGRNLSLAEWQGLFGQEPYQRTFTTLPHHREAIRAKIPQARNTAENGEVKKSAQIYKEVVAWSIEQDDVWLCNEVCDDGCRVGMAKVVAAASEHAARLVPDNRTFRKTRGIARALTGNIQGASEDFRICLDGVFDDEREQLQKWIVILEKYNQPLTVKDL